jgi:hypothetical protein
MTDRTDVADRRAGDPTMIAADRDAVELAVA